jgi:hypothetical protein
MPYNQHKQATGTVHLFVGRRLQQRLLWTLWICGKCRLLTLLSRLET